jgi:hypothetical protein
MAEQIARILVIVGVLFVVAGGLVFLAARLGLPLGRLPGDIRIQTDNLTCLFPLATMIILSIVLTVVVNVVIRFFR